ncbi:MAG: hypothetical protein IKU27_02525, partial [Clostridia bacterium]|nr:hypothetical protein [Clostridia bacterium]
MAGMLAMLMLLGGCQAPKQEQTADGKNETVTVKTYENAVNIALSDDKITVDGSDITEDNTQTVYKANDIVYYEAGHDFTYGEGEASDEHTADEAAAHTVVHITKTGTYALSGDLSKGQV